MAMTRREMISEKLGLSTGNSCKVCACVGGGGGGCIGGGGGMYVCVLCVCVCVCALGQLSS